MESCRRMKKWKDRKDLVFLNLYLVGEMEKCKD